MVLAFLYREEAFKLRKLTYGFSKYLSDISSTILFSDYSDDFNVNTIKEVISAKNAKSFKSNKFYTNNLNTIRILEEQLNLSQCALFQKLMQSFAFLVFEANLNNLLWMNDLQVEQVFLFINLETIAMDDIFVNLRDLLKIFQNFQIKARVVLISYCTERNVSVYSRFLGLKNNFNDYMFNEVIVLSDKNFDKSKKLYTQLLQIIKQ